MSDITDNWDHTIEIASDDNLYKLLEVVGDELKRIDLEVESLYDNRFVESATGEELEKLGDLVGINRKTDEPDEKLRKRIFAGFASQASDTTYESFCTTAISILDGSSQSVEVVTPPQTQPKVVQLIVDSQVLEENPLTQDELQVLLNGAVSIDARVMITVDGTFAFEGDDSSLEGFNEGTWSSTQ